MNKHFVLKSRGVLLFITIAYCMKLFETQTISIVMHPRMIFYVISTFSIALMALFFIRSAKKDSVINNYKKNKSISEIQLIYILLIGYFLIFGIFCVNDNYRQLIKSNVIYNFTFVFFIIVSSCFIAKYKLFLEIIKYLYCSTTGFLLYCCFTNFDNFQVLKNLHGMLTSFDRYTTAYGLYHKNALGNLCLIALILGIIYYKISLFKKTIAWKSIYLIFQVLLLLMLLSSGSRSSITGLILYIFLILSLFWYYRCRSNKAKFIIIISLLVIFLLSFFSLNIDILSIFNETSNRQKNFTINLPTLLKSGRIWIGLGLVNPGAFGTGELLLNTFYIDNYYLYVFMSSGIIGSTILAIVLILIVKALVKIGDATAKIIAISLLLVDLYIGLFETCIINALFPSSFVYLLIIFTLAHYQDKK